MVSIGSNINSLRAQRQLNDATSSLERSFERLASGMRITRASDDAAGLSISESLRVDSRIFQQGQRNLNDGISLLSIADGAVTELKSILVRIRELSTQAANGVYTNDQRKPMDTEAKALAEEYNRIIKTTQFNGRAVFNEQNGPLNLQAGYGTEGVLTVDTDTTIDFGANPTRVNTTSAGGESGAGSISSAALSLDGRYLVFSSSATNLVANDTNGMSDVFRKDLLTGEIIRVSTNSDGLETTGGLFNTVGSISADGRFVTFSSTATNLVSGDSNGVFDLFRKDIVTGEVVRVNTTSAGAQSLGSISDPGKITADGRYVFFSSDASDLVVNDSNFGRDIFRKDLMTGEIIRVNTSSTGVEASLAVSSGGVSISADGRYVAFHSTAYNLVANDTNNNSDVFRKDLFTGETIRVSTTSAGAESSSGSTTTGPVQLSADGRFVSFSTSLSLDAADVDGGNSDVYTKDVLTGVTTLASSTVSGADGDGFNFVAATDSSGKYVVFSSTGVNLVTPDTNGLADLYIKNIETGEIVRIDAPGGVQANGFSGTPALFSGDGSTVFFTSSATNFVSGDTNGSSDLFAVQNPFGEQYSVQLLHSVSLQTQGAANAMQEFIDGYFNNLNLFTGQLGAAQQRATIAINVLSGTDLNSQLAAGRISDVSVADETAALIAAQIKQQIASSIIAQANAQPNLVLSLLR
jgi:flagellin-like hook-associated protein FlgL